MSPTPAAVAHQAERAAISERTAQLVRAFWARVDPDAIAVSWRRNVPAVAELIAAGQLDAARQADPFLTALLVGEEPAGRLVPEAFAGVDGSGRDLLGMLMYPAWSALSAIKRGASIVAGLLSGQVLLELLARTLVADAGRAADLAGMIARPGVTSYIRVVELPACARCIILAGREYSMSTGFQRHPQCDCTMEPITRDHEPRPLFPGELFDSMSPEQRKKVFGAAATEAIEAGADIAQVVNARRGMRTATYYGRQIQTTSEGTTKRGIAGARRGRFERVGGQRYARSRSPRLMPEEILRLANGDRDKAIQLLKRHAYIV